MWDPPFYGLQNKKLYLNTPTKQPLKVFKTKTFFLMLFPLLKKRIFKIFIKKKNCFPKGGIRYFFKKKIYLTKLFFKI